MTHNKLLLLYCYYQFSYSTVWEYMIVLYCAQDIMVYFETYKYDILLLVHCSFPYWSSQKSQLIYNILIPDEMIGLFHFCCLLLFNASQVLSHSEIISLSVFIFFYLFGDFTFFINLILSDSFGMMIYFLFSLSSLWFSLACLLKNPSPHILKYVYIFIPIPSFKK